MTVGGAGVGLVLACLVALATIEPTTAMDATPIAFDVDPARCTIAPRELGDLERILSSATPAAPVERPPTGDPIDPASETGRAAIDVIETLFACLNAGDRLRSYALYTDAYLASILQPGDLPEVTTPHPNDPDELTAILDIDLFSLASGGVLAKVALDPALIPVDKIFEFILVPVDGAWKIDAVINEIDFSLP